MRTLLLFAASLPVFAAGMPIRGLHLGAPKPGEVATLVRFITDALPKEGVNTLVLEIDYHYKFQRRPEVTDADALSLEDVKQIVDACRRAGIRLIPQMNCLGHQSWDKTTYGLLRSHPEFDETPGKYPDNKGIYCRSYCPLHPKVHDVVFDVIDEVADAFSADAVHIGMDEVFLLGENECPRCRGKLKADLFAAEVRTLHDHLAGTKRETWMWADRFIDGTTAGIGEWEASMNQTYPAIHQVPNDIVMCDWHYEVAVPTAAWFAVEGFPVVSSPWRDAKVGAGLVDLIRSVRSYGNEAVASRMRGVLQTTWVAPADFIKAYYGDATAAKEPREAAECFRKVFAELRKMDQ